MFQWFIEVEIVSLERGVGETQQHATPRTMMEAYGPSHSSDGEAKAWIRRAELASTGPYRLAGPPVRTRTIVVLEGLDDDETPAAATATQAEVEGKRKRRGKGDLAVVPAATIDPNNGHGAADGFGGEDPPHAPSVRRADDLLTLKTVPFRPEEYSVSDLMILADDTGNTEDIREAAANEIGRRQTADRARMAAQVSAKVDAANPAMTQRAAEQEATTGIVEGVAIGPIGALVPCVDLRGLVLELFTGEAWYWQKYQTAGVAEKTAKRLQEMIESGADAKGLRGLAVMMKPGRAPTAEA